MPQHKYEQLSDDSELDFCVVCGGLEGSMTSDCSGSPMSSEQSASVYYGNLDYRDGDGWVRGLSPMGENIVMRKLIDMEMGRKCAPKTEAEIIIKMGVPKEEFYRVKRKYLKYTLSKGE